MDMRSVLELLNKTVDDCSAAIEKGFSPELNMLTIREQLEKAVSFLGSIGTDVLKTESAPSGQKQEGEDDGSPAEPESSQREKDTETAPEPEKTEQEAAKQEEAEKTVEETSIEVETKPRTLSSVVNELSKNVNLKKAQPPVEEAGNNEYKRLPLKQTNAVQPLKSSSFLPEKPKGE